MGITFRLLLIIVSLILYAGMGSASELARVNASHSTISLKSEMAQVAPGSQVWLGFEITPIAGWHAYWKNPGDSGAAPILDWQLEGGAKVGHPLFPVPKRLPLGPLVNYGYDAPVTLLFPVQVPEIGTELKGVVNAEWLICEVECVPQFAELTFSIPIGQKERDTTAVKAFTTARNALPEPSYWDGKVTVNVQTSEVLVYMSSEEVAEISSAYYFPESEGLLDYAADQTLRMSNGNLILIVPRPAGSTVPNNANGLLKITYASGDVATFAMEPILEVSDQAGGTEETREVTATNLPLWQAAIFALLGGVILNLMPCVFPVLSLKAFAFVSANYKTAANRQKEGWAYTLGIWASFMVIVAVLMALRAGGTSIGWGFQLQEPVFVALMVILLVLVALSLSGMFTIQLGVEGAGQQLAAHEGARGAFFKGVLAALVATPCTAPLMAPAIGFALTQSLPVVFLIFTCLAFGLALPFLALSYSPALARAMPKPGPWMEKVKEALAFPMYLTAAWLLYIFDRQVGAVGTLMLLAAIIAIVFSVWLAKQGSGSIIRFVSWGTAVLAIAVLLAQPWQTPERDPNAAHVEESPYSYATLQALKEEGKSVFVYFTADWCITCKVNERLAIETDQTQAALIAADVQVLKGDWTNRNAEIGNVLARFGRAGVPLYLYYPAGKEDPIILPEILGPGTIRDIILNEAG